MTNKSVVESVFNNSTKSGLINGLENYLNNIELDMNSWLKKFDWDRDVLMEKYQINGTENITTCPYNQSHTRIKKQNFNKHIEKCRLISQNFSSEDIIDFYKRPLVNPEHQLVLNDQTNSSGIITISYDTHEEFKKPSELVTFTNKQYFTDLSTRERLAIHEFAKKKVIDKGYRMNSTQQPFLEASKLIENSNETAIDLRDIKRRPKSYKTKKNTSYTEKIKALIDYQMGLIDQMSQREAEKIVGKSSKLSDQLSDHGPKKSSHKSKRKHSKEESSERKPHKSHKKKKTKSSKLYRSSSPA